MSERERLGDRVVGDIVRFPDGSVGRLAWPGRDPVKGAKKKGEIAGWFIEFRELAEVDFGEEPHEVWSRPRWFDASAEIELLESPNTDKKRDDAGEDAGAGDADPLRAAVDRLPKRHNPNQGGLL